MARGRKSGARMFNPKTHKVVKKHSTNRTGMASGF